VTRRGKALTALIAFTHPTAPRLPAVGRLSAIRPSNRRALRSGKKGPHGRADAKFVPGFRTASDFPKASLPNAQTQKMQRRFHLQSAEFQVILRRQIEDRQQKTETLL